MPNLPGMAQKYLVQEYGFTGRYGKIGPDTLPDYSSDILLLESGDSILLETGDFINLELSSSTGATEEQKLQYAWISPDSGIFADGTEAYKII